MEEMYNLLTAGTCPDCGSKGKLIEIEVIADTVSQCTVCEATFHLDEANKTAKR